MSDDKNQKRPVDEPYPDWQACIRAWSKRLESPLLRFGIFRTRSNSSEDDPARDPERRRELRAAKRAAFASGAEVAEEQI